MAMVYITLKIMPEGVETNLEQLAEKAKLIITEFEGKVAEVKEEPVAFGLKSVNITFMRDEEKGSSDDMEDKIAEVEGVMSVTAIDVRRALG